MKRVSTLLAAMALLSLTAAAPVDPTADAVAKARRIYEQSMQTVRDDIVKAIDAKIESAGRPGKADKDKLKAATDEKDAFAATGAIPDVPKAAQFERRYRDAARTMDEAYTAALAMYVKLSNVPLRDAIRAESEQFAAAWDLAPWRDFAEADDHEGVKRTLAKDATVTVSLETTDNYRLQVVGRRDGAAGTLSIELPCGKKRLRVPVEFTADGRFSVLLSVSEKKLAWELGLARGTDAEPVDGDDAGLKLIAAGGAVRIESLRTKPIVEGKPLETPRVKDAPAPEAFDLGKLIPKGSTWTGRLSGSTDAAGAVTAKVASQDGDSAVLDITDAAGKHKWMLAFRGESFEVVSISGGRGSPPSRLRGSGAVSGRRLQWSGSWIIQSTKGGKAVNATLELSRSE